MKTLKERISLTVDSDVIEQIRIKAENCERSVSQYINMVLKAHINSEAKEKEQEKLKTPNKY